MSMCSFRRTAAAALGLAALGLCHTARATTEWTFTTELGGIAQFVADDSAGTLTLTLTNSQPPPPTGQANVLGALLFDYQGTPVLDPLSAYVANGSGVYSLVGSAWETFDYPDGYTVGDIGPEWAFNTFTESPITGISMTAGVSAMGYGEWFGTALTFASGDLGGDPGGAIDGSDFALVNGIANDTVPSPVHPLENNSPYVINSINGDSIDGASAVFTWTYTGTINVPQDIPGVWFQFGTDPPTVGSEDDPQFTPVPEPASMALLALGVAVMGAGLRRRRRKP